jgi:hypothetical protein
LAAADAAVATAAAAAAAATSGSGANLPRVVDEVGCCWVFWVPDAMHLNADGAHSGRPRRGVARDTAAEARAAADLLVP